MNNPIRAVLHRQMEARVLKRLGGRMQGGLALELGCGRGIGARIVHPLLRRILAHPQEDRFDHACFTEELQQISFKIIDTEGFMQLYGWFIADKPATLNVRQ